jgi:hypothetical protein
VKESRISFDREASHRVGISCNYLATFSLIIQQFSSFKVSHVIIVHLYNIFVYILVEY